MPIWIKMKVFAPFDNISNPGTKFQTIDGKKQVVDPTGSGPFKIRKGQFVPIPFEWKPVFEKDEKTKKEILVTPGLEQAKEKFDQEIFEFFKTKQEAAAKCKKEEKLLAMLPTKKFEERRKRVQDKVDKARWGQKRPTMEDVIKEAKNIGVDMPINFALK